MSEHTHDHDYISNDLEIKKNEKTILIVVVLTFITMVVEIIYGTITGSMALLADGWHMGSHVGALGIAFLAYKLAQNKKFSSSLTFGAGKVLPLGGYTSALLLLLVSCYMIIESVFRLINPVEIEFNTAIIVAIIGLIVNLLSAYILKGGHSHHHDEEHECEHSHGHDHNHESAFWHVVADALTSALAIIALLLGSFFDLYIADPIMGIIGGLVILRWSFSLIKATARELLDGAVQSKKQEKLRKLLEKDGSHVCDLHLWKIAPNALAAEVRICRKELQGAAYYRELIYKKFHVEHLIIEERLRD